MIIMTHWKLGSDKYVVIANINDYNYLLFLCLFPKNGAGGEEIA
ncbi:hypothetical protein PL11201_530183 [Planktothrix sp. PCC 11201]|nr:hypothetical protein PL11201_530183 [Planktothrix sp. PCC 11201]